jgi:putative transposase
VDEAGLGPGELILHADRGSPMKAKTTALLLADLGVGKSHSRPHVSNDNPFSESQFKTLKYNPQFPDRFGPPWIPGYSAVHSSNGTTRSSATVGSR